MTGLLMLILVFLELIYYLEFRRFVRLWTEALAEKQPKSPPKARKSFVVKRMEERLKEALYQ